MPCRIDGVKIKRQGLWSLTFRQVKPTQHLPHPWIRLHAVIKGFPETGPYTVDFGFRSGPEHGGSLDARFFSRHPKRLGIIPPEAIMNFRQVRHLEHHTRTRFITQGIVDNTIMIRHLAGHQRIVVGKGQ